MQKISFFHLFILQIQSILEFHHMTFGHTNLLHFQSPFNLYRFVSACKKSVNSIISFLRYIQFYSPDTTLAIPIFDHAQSKKLQSTFNFCQFVSTYLKWGCFITLFWRRLGLKILQSDWLRAFWPISQEKDFSQIQDLSSNTVNTKNIYCRTTSVQINDQIFL